MSAMTSIDPDRAASVGRRSFLALAAQAVFWLTGGAAAVGLSRYLSYEPARARPSRFTLDVPEAYPFPSRVVVAAGAAVYHDEAGFFARSLTCAHLGCRVQPSDDGGFACPCHGSRFAHDGGRLRGPAPRDLEGVALAFDDKGRLVLDLSTTVDPAWRLPAGATVGRGSPSTSERKG